MRERTSLSGNEVESVRSTVAITLGIRPDGVAPGVEEVTAMKERLTAHAERLLSLAKNWNDARRRTLGSVSPQLVGYGLLYVRRVIDYGAPAAETDPWAALVWCQELACAVSLMLDVLVREARP
ncbi:hypothetical protein ACH4PU_36165 [Streptomyces sp. NPDC021100]|uniref:hypothetical protein n=1 Tax=Streptomyces sp. NPDC021100 TaxID=3365114 RepID=UPI003793FA1B